MIRLFLCSVAFSLVALYSPAQEINEVLMRKAVLHFNNEEWREAAAMFNVLINESPSLLELYPYAVASNDMAEDGKGVIAAVELSEKSGIPLDSLFCKTYDLCSETGNVDIYERLLLCIKNEQPWFKRIVNRYLLRFYMERKDCSKAAAIVDELLETFPDNPELMKAKAEILTESGDIDGAAGCMEKVLAVDSKSTDARLFLGNYYFIKGSSMLDSMAVSAAAARNDSVGIAANADTVDYGSAARAMFLKAACFLEMDSGVNRTPFVRNTINAIREGIGMLSDSLSLSAPATLPSK